MYFLPGGGGGNFFAIVALYLSGKEQSKAAVLFK
jgi:hypothetical protein